MLLRQLVLALAELPEPGVLLVLPVQDLQVVIQGFQQGIIIISVLVVIGSDIILLL